MSKAFLIYVFQILYLFAGPKKESKKKKEMLLKSEKQKKFSINLAHRKPT